MSDNKPWEPGKKIHSPFSETVAIDPSSLSIPQIYNLLIDAIVPRPTAFVTTTNKKGQVNLAPFSYFNGVSTKPACLMISITHKRDGSKKDTLVNIEETCEFVVNSSNEWLAEPMVHCAAAYPYGVNEMEKVGLTAEPSKIVAPPRVKEAAVSMECKTYKTVLIGDGSAGSSTMVIGEIVLIHIAKEFYSNGRIDIEKYRPLARLGGASYGKITDVFDLMIPKV